MKTATNPQTGERVAYIDGEWQPLRTATNAAGDKVAFNGASWEPLGEANATSDLLSDQRKEISSDATLQFGPWDTGIGIPQWLDEGLAGAGREMMELVTAGKHQGTSDHLLDDSAAATVGAIGTDIMGMTGVGKGLGLLAKGAGAIPKLQQGLQWGSKAFTAPTTLPQGAVSGGAIGGLLSDGSAADRAKGAATGATGGLLGVAAPRVLGNVVAPKVSNSVQKLLDKDIPLTPGMMGNKWLGAAEEQLSSIPLVGSAVSGARREAIKGWNRSVVDDALGDIGETLPSVVNVGADAFDHAYKTISKRYDDILTQMPITVTQPIVDALEKPAGYQYLSKAAKNKWRQAVNDVKTGMEAGTIPGEGFKKLDSQLRARYRALLKSQSPADNDAGRLLQDMHQKLLAEGSSQHPILGRELANADKAYAKISAAGAAKNASADDLFTPKQLNRQIKKRSTDSQMARGKAAGQSDLQPALDALPATVPDSGTAQRLMMGSGLSALGAMASGLPVSPLLFAAPAAAALPYTKGAGALLRAYAQPGAKRAAIGQGLGAFAPKMGLLGGSAASQ